MNDSLNNLSISGERSSRRFFLHPVSAAVVAGMAVMALTLVSGCASDEYDDEYGVRGIEVGDPVAADPDIGYSDPAIENDEEIEAALRISALSGVPEEIRPMILDDLEDATITSVNSLETQGGIIYEVIYIQNGKARQARYDRSGRQVDLAGDAVGPGYGERAMPAAAAEEPIELGEPLIEDAEPLGGEELIERNQPGPANAQDTPTTRPTAAGGPSTRPAG